MESSPLSPHLNSPRPVLTGAPPCCSSHDLPAALLSVKKEGANRGRWFWTCSNVGDQCKFFAWSDGVATPQSQAARAASGAAAGPSRSPGGKRVAHLVTLPASRFAVEAPFDASLVELLKGVPGGRWEPAPHKRWTFPSTAQPAVEEALASFADERPGWEVQPPPPFVRALLASSHTRRLSEAAVDALVAKLPAGAGAGGRSLQRDLKAYQLEGVRQLLSREARGLLADEPGLGKTAQAIAVMACHKVDWPLLVLCPSGVRDTWLAELRAWLPPGFAAVRPVASGRDASTVTASPALVVVCSYDLAASLPDLAFGCVIADESHSLKSRTALRTKAALPRLQSARRVLALTGTPLLSRPAEVFTTLQALLPHSCPAWARFAQRYCAPRPSSMAGQGTDYSGASCVSELNMLLLATVMVRRTKAEVSGEAALPAKTRETVTLQLAPATAARLAGAKARADSAHQQYARGHPMAQQAVTAFYVATGAAKAEAAAAHVVALLRGDPQVKVLAFGHHKQVLDAVEAAVKHAGVPYLRIDGETSQAARQRVVAAFQAPASAVRVAVLSLGAAAVGLTLTAATRVVFAELSWTPGLLLQAEDRAHRVGQTQAVQVQYLLTAHSLDDLMWPVIQRKLAITGTAVDGRGGALRLSTGGCAGPAAGERTYDMAPLRLEELLGSAASPRRRLAAEVIDLCDEEDVPVAQRARGEPRRQSGAPGDEIELE